MSERRLPTFSLDTPSLARYHEQTWSSRDFLAGKLLVERLAIGCGDHVLDVGSGPGLLAAHIAQRVGADGSVVGIDALRTRIELAHRKRQQNLRFEPVGDYDLSRFPADSFDAVVINTVFYWIPDKAALLAQVHRLLKPGGRLGVRTGSRDHPRRAHEIRAALLSEPPFNAFPEAGRGVYGWPTVGEMSTMLAATGYRDATIELHPNNWVHASAKSMIASSEANTFGNYFGHLPEALQRLARQRLAERLERYRTHDGIHEEGARILALARK